MCDTNWCTFCDCAVSPFSSSVYCSDECRKRDASAHNYLPTAFVEELRQKQEYGINTVHLVVEPMMTPPLQPLSRRASSSSSSICSTDLAAMYFDLLPSTPPDEKNNLMVPSPPSLSSSVSPGHDDMSLRTPVSFSSCSSTICEKLSPVMLNQPYSQYVQN
ncbi:hypothetical protein BDF21DRAFT_418735 [Thamnidium elegans]|uniref:Uncharacterized protein n=1 Tax=Thamnidium elegans TaxID=101142 RepID=A0A8H7SQL7_9FUNG|nr:hypothetical protein INT48_005402 [Thamnidium elegans]KAI8081239.1 hypothetical protein BDF21DRAFT_418735 [Thamnidium elegans]